MTHNEGTSSSRVNPILCAQTDVNNLEKMSEPQRPHKPMIGEVTHYSIELIWESKILPDEFKKPVREQDAVKYEVQEEEVANFSGKGLRIVYSGYKTSHVFQGLEPSTVYNYRVRAMNAYGVSPWSPTVEIGTKKQPPSSEDLHRAVQAGDIQKINRLVQVLHRDLLDAPDKYNYTPLMSAAQRGRKDVAEILIQSGADVNYQNPSGKTCLMIACFAGQVEVGRLLQKHNADLSMKDRTGSTAMHWACDGRSAEIVHWLLSCNCEVDSKDYTSGWTPLMRLAATNGDVEIAKVLVLNGADVNTMDVDRKTVLMIAALNGHMDLVQLLVSRGANIGTRSSHGKTAIDFARAFEHKEVQLHLEQQLHLKKKQDLCD